MKIIFKEFYCPECGQIRWLKIKNICVDCRDKQILNEISQIRKIDNIFNREVYV
jgi:hypothetical protein